MNEYDKLIKIIDQYEVISFDIFDTLLLRNVQEPKDIFKILAKYVKDKYKILDFANIRIKAEERSRTEANKYETSLKEIYEYIDIDEKIKEDIKLKELELEEKFLRANPFMQKIYNYCLEKKKKVICITDMYLPLEFLEKILKKNGYNKVKIYLSCYYHKHKGNMTLYDEVQKEENIAKDKWLHIGDNHFSDYDKAIEFGIHAYHYQRIRERSALPKAESLGASIIWSIASNEALNGLDISYWSKFGILYASSIYFGFTNWLYNKLKDQDNIYFLARDGYIIEKVFAKFKKITKLNITTKYLYLVSGEWFGMLQRQS